MTNPTRDELLDALRRLGERYPDWRFGQLVVNAVVFASAEAPKEIYDVEDNELLTGIQGHFDRTSRSEDTSRQYADA